MSDDDNEDRFFGLAVVTASQFEAVTNARPTNHTVAGKYFPTELISLFIIMKRLLTIGTTEWEDVVVEHSLDL